MDAEDLLLREFLGIREERRSALSAAWIRSQQREDGSWGELLWRARRPVDHRGVLCGAQALRRRRGRRPHGPRARVHPRGRRRGERARVHAHLARAVRHLALGRHPGAAAGADAAAGRRACSSIYSFACWGRQTVAALTVVWACRPVRPLPFGLDELFSGASREVERGSLRTLRGWFGLADRFLHRYEKRPLGWLRRLALARAERWIIARQEADGSWGGIQPPWVYSMMALDLRGYPDGPSAACRPRSRAWSRSRSTRTTAAGSRPASRRCGTRRWR